MDPVHEVYEHENEAIPHPEWGKLLNEILRQERLALWDNGVQRDNEITRLFSMISKAIRDTGKKKSFTEMCACDDDGRCEYDPPLEKTKEGRPDPGEDRMTEDYAEKHLNAALRLLEERGDDYGPAGKCMRHAAGICEAMWGLQLEARDIARVLFGLKIAREQWRHKDDNVHDALAYLAILGSLSEGNDE